MKILILYTNFGAGHYFAAKQLNNELVNIYGSKNVYMKNSKYEQNPFMTKLIEKIYANVFTKYASNKFINYVYGIFFKIANIRFISHFAVQKTGYKVVQKTIKSYNPNIIICTYPHYIKTNIPCIIYLTDYIYADVWKSKKNDIYVVKSRESQQFFLENGINKKNIYLSKIVLDYRFKNVNQDKIVNSVLFNLGARGQFEYKNLIININVLLKEKVKISIMCGKNTYLFNELNIKYGDEIKVYPFIKNVYSVVNQHSLIITKAGGISVTECIQSEKPMIINLSQTLKGQEIGNYKYILNNKIGVGINEKYMYKEILKYINDPEYYVKTIKNLQKLKIRMNSYKKIAEIIEEIK